MMPFAPPIVQTRLLHQPADLLRLADALPNRYPCLLSSVSDANPLHRYDLLFADLSEVSIDVLAEVDVSVDQATDLPFLGGYVVFLPYEYAQQIEPHLVLPTNMQSQARVWQVTAAFIWDRQTQCLHLVAQPAFAHLLPSYWQDWDALGQTDMPLLPLGKHQLVEEDAQAFLDGVARCRDYILAGDVFQVNLSRGWAVRFEEAITPTQVFAHLRRANPAPFSAVLTQADWGIVSSSPERLISVRSGVIDTRPIAGTRRRGEDMTKDLALIDELRAHPKENAEHIMLLDLERNDLGRVCVAGSVRVNELMTVETYAHVHHIVSNVQGQLKAGTSAKAALDATFPGGTITGCPKVRCMEIIAELEQTPRDVYTGSLGYVSLDGQMDLNILIRSFRWQPQHLSFRAGAGIVYDSIAQAELEETRHKAKGLIRAL
jgi:anthranilate synthase component 1